MKGGDTDTHRYRLIGSRRIVKRVLLGLKWTKGERKSDTMSSRGTSTMPVCIGRLANESSPNENQFLKFVSYFRGPILYVMEIAVVLAAGLQDWIDFGVIIGILIMNAVVGWYQEK